MRTLARNPRFHKLLLGMVGPLMMAADQYAKTGLLLLGGILMMIIAAGFGCYRLGN